MSLELEKLSPENADLAKSLQDLGVSDEDIIKSLNIEQDTDKKDGDNINKSVEDEIAEKEKELEDLRKSLNSDKDKDPNDEFSKKIDQIEKSLTDQISEINTQVDGKVDGLGTLIKSLTSIVTDLKNGNDKVVSDNEELKKSIGDSMQVLEKIAAQSPGLKSLTGANPVQRFEKSFNDDGKEIFSKSKNKVDIASKLSAKMDDQEFIKSYGTDVSNYEVSGKMSDRLEKAVVDEFKIELVD